MFTKKTAYSVLFSMLFTSHCFVQAEELEVEHFVPKGFAQAETTMQFLLEFNHQIFPGYLSFNHTQQHLTFNSEQYRANGIKDEAIIKLKSILEKISVADCLNGCDISVDNYQVLLDKVNQRITILEDNKNVMMPNTGFGLVHNQSVKFNANSEQNYSAEIQGNGYIGLPWQSFFYFNWQAKVMSMLEKVSISSIALNNFYLQKNFLHHYLRLGQGSYSNNQNTTVSTRLQANFNRFLVFGSQQFFLHENINKTVLSLYANMSGQYKLYRDGVLIFTQNAKPGRNVINYHQLPIGYYNVDVQLVDMLGNILNRSQYLIDNTTYAMHKSWAVSVGDSAQQVKQAQMSVSYPNRWSYNHFSLLGNENLAWAAEANIGLRNVHLNGLSIIPMLGGFVGEKGAGGYAKLNINLDLLGAITLSYNNAQQVSALLMPIEGASFSYQKQFNRFSFNYLLEYSKQIFQNNLSGSLNWKYKWFDFSLSADMKQIENSYRTNLSARISLFDSIQTHTSYDLNQRELNSNINYGYNKLITDDYGTTHFNLNSDFHTDLLNRKFALNHISGEVEREGTRGKITAKLGQQGKTWYGALAYNSMLALNNQAIGFGRSSSSGSALLVKTPKLAGMDYSFDVSNTPLAGGGIYAVPVPQYKSFAFFKTQNRRTDMDMDIRLPTKILRAHPGQVFISKAQVQIDLLYNGFFVDEHKKPVSGLILETEDSVAPNGMFSINIEKPFLFVTVKDESGITYRCDLKQIHENYQYFCIKHIS